MIYSQDSRPVSLEELSELLSGEAAGSPRLIDLRPRAAFEAGHLPGASRLEPAEIDVAYLRPPRWRSLVIVGDDAISTDDAACQLRGLGYQARGMSVGIRRIPGPRETGPEARPAWEPSPLVALWAGRLPVGETCDLACGSGRDAVFLALHGHAVTAIDILPDALEQGGRLAERHGVKVHFACGNVEANPHIWNGPWNTIVIQRFLHRPTLALLHDRLHPDGTILYETFLQDQARTGKKPRDLAFLLKSGELLAAASGLEVLYYREAVTEGGDSTAALVAREGGGRAPR